MLCGVDHHSGKSYEHRRDWIKQRLVFLAKHYGIDVLGYAVMGNPASPKNMNSIC